MRHLLISFVHACIGLALMATTVSAQPRAAQSRSAQPAGSVRLSVELPDNPMVGARLFVSKQCVRCHALGSSQTPVGPDLGRIQFPGTVLDLAGAFWNHSPMMREKMKDLKIQRPTFTTQEMADLLAFLTAYRYYLTQLGEPGNPTTGKAVFAAKRCDTCHGDRDWRKPGPSLDQYRGGFSALFLAQAMWNHRADMAAVLQERQIPWPKFSGREMGDLLAYLQVGNAGADRVYFEPGSPRRGRELFAEKRCTVCHAIAGAGGQAGPDLGALGPELIGPVARIAGLMWNHSLGMSDEFERVNSRARFSSLVFRPADYPLSIRLFQHTTMLTAAVNTFRLARLTPTAPRTRSAGRTNAATAYRHPNAAGVDASPSPPIPSPVSQACAAFVRLTHPRPASRVRSAFGARRAAASR